MLIIEKYIISLNFKFIISLYVYKYIIMTKKQVQSYGDYLRKNNDLKLKNEKKYVITYKKNQGLIDNETANDMINELNITDNVLTLADAKLQLGEYLSKYIKNKFYLNKIVDSPNLTQPIQNQLVLNWETTVEPRLTALRNYFVS